MNTDQNNFENSYDNFGNNTSAGIVGLPLQSDTQLNSALPDLVGEYASPKSLGSGTTTAQLTQAFQYINAGKQSFTDDTAGYILGIDTDGKAKFRLGTTGHYIYFDGSTLTVIGGVNIDHLDIPDTTTANSFHVDTSGNAWWGTNVATGYATAPAKILNTGAATFSSVTITGGSVATSTLSGTISQSNLSIANQGWTQTCVFSSTNSTKVSWGSGTFTAANGTSYSISSGDTGTMSSRTYIYLDINVSTVAYQITTTATTAVGVGKVLIATAINGTTSATYQTFGGIGGLFIDGVNIVNGSISSAKGNLALRGWTQTCAFSVSSSTKVSWGSGTFTASDGTSYSISSGDTGTMAAKTYIYLDIGISTTAYQITTTATTAVGDGKVLIAVAQNNTTEAVFILLNDDSQNIDASNIVTGSITANEIAASTITGGKIAATTITASNIASNTITASQIAAATITTNEIASNTIVANNIAASTITAAKMSVSQLSAIAADLGTITAGSLTINGGTAAIDSSGNATFKSVSIGGSTTQYQVNNNGIFSFGDGSDGSATITSNTSLTSDKYYTNLTINNGATLKPSGYRIFCTGTLTIGGASAGTISGDGNAGQKGLVGTGGAGATALADGYLKGSYAGANGGVGGGSGNNGTSTSNSLGSNGANGGPGHNGGAQGSGGTATPSNVKLIANWHLATLLDISSTGSTVKFDNSAAAGGGWFRKWW